MNSKIKFIIPFLSLILIFSFAMACGGGSEASSTTEKTEAVATEGSETTITETTAPETTQPEITQVEEPGQVKFVGSIKSDVFHYLNCSYVKKIKEENKIYFSSYDEAVSKGYKPCKIFKPTK